MKSRVLTALRVGLGIAIGGALALYAYRHRADFSAIADIDARLAAVAIAFELLRRIFDSARLVMLYRAVGARFSLFEMLAVSQVALAMNTFVVGQSGAAARAVYAKRRHGLPYAQTPAVLLAAQASMVAIAGVVLLGVNLSLLHGGMRVAQPLWIASAIGMGVTLLFFVHLPEAVASRLGPLGRFARLFDQGWAALRRSTRELALSCGYQLLALTMVACLVSTSYLALGLHLGVPFVIAMAAFASLAKTVIITPGNIGVFEAAVTYIGQLAGLSFPDALAGAAVLRALNLSVTLVAAPLSWPFVRRGRR